MEITKREIVLSISIIALMMIFGTMLSGKISDSINDVNEVYNKALQIEEEEIFKYGMETNVGNAFVYGTIQAVDAVSYPEIEGEYLYIEKVKERHEMKTRTVTYTDANGKTKTRTETYWEWERVGSEEKKSTKVSFLGSEFNFNQFRTPSSSYIATIKESSHVRYKYYGVAPSVTGTIFASLENNDVGSNIPIYENVNTQEAYEIVISSNFWLWVFWIVWVLLTGGIVYAFYYFENDWLY